MRCPSCGFLNQSQVKFCGDCGTRLALDGEAAEGERRQLTVMFCDLVGSTSLSERLDPEELRDLLRGYQDRCARVVARFGGIVSQYLGDGILMYFGYPEAHEDDARRAVHAGLGILEEMKDPLANAEDSARAAVKTRIGIHTGLVVMGAVGDPAAGTVLGIGETPNVAARVQGFATPDTVVVSGNTYRLARDHFEWRSLGPQSLKGLSQPIEVHQALRPRDAPGYDADTAGVPLAPVGREPESKVLMDAWRRSRTEGPQTVLVSGESGIGKSRLIQQLKDSISASEAWLTCRCSPYYTNTALHPVIDLVHRLCEIRPEDTATTRVSKLKRLLADIALQRQDLTVLTELLSLPRSGSDRAHPNSPARLRRQAFRTLADVLRAVIGPSGGVVVAEDLHWSDPSTRDFLASLPTAMGEAPILLVLTHRPELRLGWTLPAESTTRLELAGLQAEHVQAIAERISGGRRLPRELIRLIATRTDGVPLFVEELTKVLLESDHLRAADGHYELVAPLPMLAVPATLRDSLMARLDRLGPAKRTAQLAAAIGRDFTYALLSEISQLDKASLDLHLQQLVGAEIVVEPNLDQDRGYGFRHALIQEAAYDSLLRSVRRPLHERIARALLRIGEEAVDLQPEVVAHHCTEGGLVKEAVRFWRQAGQQAIRRSGNAEAAAHLTKALELIVQLPGTSERAAEELAIRTALGPALIAMRGYGAPEVEDVYAQARELSSSISDSPDLFPVRYGLLAFYLARGRMDTARDIGEELLAMSHHADDKALRLVADFSLGTILYYRGELGLARELLEDGISLYDPEPHSGLRFEYVFDPGTACRRSLALVLWLLGDATGSEHHASEAIGMAQQLSHPFSLAAALVFGAMLCQHRGDLSLARERATSAITIAEEHGFPFWLSSAKVLNAWVATMSGDTDACDLIRVALDAAHTSGSEIFRPYWFGLLAECYLKTGRADQARAAAAEGARVSKRTGERFWAAELYRLEAEALRIVNPDDLPSACRRLVRALHIARKQGAVALEARTAEAMLGAADAR